MQIDLIFGRFFSYFNALTCRHDHEGAEDAEMGLYFYIDMDRYDLL